MKQWFIVGLLMTTVLNGCALLTDTSDAPTQLQLTTIQQHNSVKASVGAAKKSRLIIETPITTPALSTRSLWYTSGEHQIMPFRDHIWTEPLNQQVARIMTVYLQSDMDDVHVLSDRPGLEADYRLRVNLHEWYLDQAQEALRVVIHVDLLTLSGQPVAGWQWQQTEPLQSINAIGLAEAGQAWLAAWLPDLSARLTAFLQ